MAHTKVTKNGTQNNGTANTFSYSGSFDVFKASEVEVELDNVALTFTTSTINESASPREYTVDYDNKTVHVGGANLASSNSVVIQPVTDMGAPTPRATYAPGSSVTSEDLNNNQLQLMRKAMEYDEQKLSSRGGTMTGNLHMGKNVDLSFEGDTDNTYETTLTVADPTADRTITFPDTTGTVVTTGDTGTVATGMIAADAVTGAKIADDQINSEHYVDGSIDTAHIGNAQVTADKLGNDSVTTTKIQNSAVTSAKIADNTIVNADINSSAAIANSKLANSSVTVGSTSIALGGTATDISGLNSVVSSEYSVHTEGQTNSITLNSGQILFEGSSADHYETSLQVTNPTADRTITLPDTTGTVVTTGDTATVTATMLAANSVDSSELVDGSIDTSHIGNSQVTTAKIAADAVTGAKIADNAINSEHYTDGSIDTAHIADLNVTTAKIAADAITGAKIADDAVDSEHLAADSIDAEHYAAASVDTTALASNAVTTAKITDSNITTVKVADSNITLAKLASDLKQTTISDSDTQIPTSGAVVDYVAAQIAPLGGLEVIATDAAFPNSQPASGVVISISDAGGVVFNGSGVSTTGRTVGGSTVTINGAPSSLYNETLVAGVGLMVSSTGSSQTYNYHKILGKEDDIKQLSDDINDFNARYRVGSSNPTSALDSGDLFFNTGTGKLLVYNGTNSAWEEAQSIGNYYINTISSYSGTGGNSASFNGSAYRFVLSNPGTTAEQHIVSVNGVIQKPNSGTSQPSEGFVIDGSSIIFSSAPATGADFFIITIGSTVNIGTPSDGTVSTAKLANGAVTTAKLADANVTTAKIADAAVTSAKIADDAVTSTKIADGAVTTDRIAGSAVNATRLADNAVTNSKIANNAVNSAKIEDGTIVNADISGSAAIALTKLATSGTPSNTNFLRGDGAWTTVNTDLVGDTTPQLGGTLDCNGQNVQFKSGGGNVKIEYDVAADSFDFVDNAKSRYGTGNDLQIYHDGTDSNITNATGDLLIDNNTTAGRTKIFTDVEFEVFVGNTEAAIKSVRSASGGQTELYHSGNKKFETSSTGATVSGNLRTNGISQSSGNLTISNNDTSNGVITIATNTNDCWRFEFNGNFEPHVNNSVNIGSTSKRVANIYTNDLHLSNEGHSNDVDGTWGNWTIQEGESDLFLKNNRSGKKYKFNLTEVS